MMREGASRAGPLFARSKRQRLLVLLPSWEKVARRASAETDEGACEARTARRHLLVQHLPKSPRTLSRARKLRREMSDEERILWMLLRDRRFAGFKFRRQVPLGDYVGDFVCYAAKLVLELDGSQHSAPEQMAFDAARTKYLETAGFRVLRITTSDFFRERENAMDTIWSALHGRM